MQPHRYNLIVLWCKGHSAVLLSYACPEFLSKGRRTLLMGTDCKSVLSGVLLEAMIAIFNYFCLSIKNLAAKYLLMGIV